MSDSTTTAVGRRDLQRDVARDHVERLADLAGDVVGDRPRVGDVVEVAAAGSGHGLEQHLVEVGAHAKGRRLHAARAELGGVLGQLVAIGDADVGQAVGQQQDAIDALAGQVHGDLLAAAQPALAEVGLVARVDPADRAGSHLAATPTSPRVERTTTSIDVVVDDHGEAIVSLETADRLLDGLLGEGDLLARHGARPIQHERQVHGRPRRPTPASGSCMCGAVISARTKRLLR